MPESAWPMVDTRAYRTPGVARGGARLLVFGKP
jgi:hypothetical protein